MKANILPLALSIMISLTSFGANAKTSINGAGATFPYPLYSKWFSEYRKEKPDILFNYQSIGSGGGIQQLIKHTVDFGASDIPMNSEEKKQAGTPILHIPTVMGAVAVVYNLPNVNGTLELSGDVLAKIFLGEIKKWNAPEIVKINPKITLPNKDITIVHRADGSGTTAIFSEYLATNSSSWNGRVGKGKNLKWPAGLGAKGNEGITAIIKQTPESIGYVELAFAITNKLHTAKIQNANREFVDPTISSISAAAKGIKTLDEALSKSLIQTKEKGAYPISSFTFILIPQNSNDPKVKEIKTFLLWALDKGKGFAQELYYAPLPQELTSSIKKNL